MPSPFDPPPSPANSFKGYSFKAWLCRNKSNVKILLTALFAFLTVRFGGIVDPALNALVGTAVIIVSKLALDAVDFWLSEGP